MQNHKGKSLFGLIKRLAALAVGASADLLISGSCQTGLIRIAVSSAVTFLFIFCFDVYNKNDPVTILKLIFVLSCPVTGVIFSLEWFFLVLFEAVIEKTGKEDGSHG